MRPSVDPAGSPRGRSGLSALVLAALMALAPALVTAAAAESAVSTPINAEELRIWLMRIQQASGLHSFQGTFVVSGGGTVSSARVAHFCEGKNQFERIDSLDGVERHVFRHNNVVHTVWPQSRVALVEQREQAVSFLGTVGTGGERIVDHYDVRRQGSDRVAGHEAGVLLLKPRDGYRYGYRLWSERSSGLLLRADVLNAKGEVLETSAFSNVVIGVRPQPDSVMLRMKSLDGYRVIRPVLVPTRLESEGWALRDTPPGFRLVSCIKRPLGPSDADRADDIQALQSIYSDGMTYVSLFIEPYDARRHTQEMLTAVGATQTLMRRHGDWWVTVMGDVPSRTLNSFASGLERSK